MARKKTNRPTICGVTLDRGMAFAIGTHAGNMHMDKHTLKPWSEEARAIAAETTNRLLMHVPLEEGGLMGIPVERLIEDGVIYVSILTLTPAPDAGESLRLCLPAACSTPSPIRR
jgi:hypothetical protein